MKQYILHRVLTLLGGMLLMIFITFVLMHMVPTDPVELKFHLAGVTVDSELADAMRAELGLDQPFWVQYGTWVVNILHGNLGHSVFYTMPVTELMSDALPNTLLLVGTSLVVGLSISLVLGYLSATRQNTILDAIIRFTSFICLSWPTFWLALLLIYIFSVKLRLISTDVSTGVAVLILPTITLAIWVSGLYIRRFRTVFLEEFSKDYIRGARALGLSESMIFKRYIAPNVMIQILPMLGVTIGTMLGGTVIVETIFGWRGMGYLMVKAIISSDYALIQGYVLWAVFVYMGINFIVDLIFMYMNPRLRKGV